MIKEVNKQGFAFVIGLFIMIMHLALILLLYFGYNNSDARGSDIEIASIAAPMTAAYFFTILQWIVLNQGKITKTQTVGYPFVFAVTLVTSVFIFILMYVPISTLLNFKYLIPDENLNSTYAFLEVLFGANLGLIMSDLFGKEDNNNVTPEL